LISYKKAITTDIKYLEGKEHKEEYSTQYTWSNGNLINCDDETFLTYSTYPNLYNIDINWFIIDEYELPLILGFTGEKSKNLISTRRFEEQNTADPIKYLD